MVGCCEYGDEPLGSIKRREILTNFSRSALLVELVGCLVHCLVVIRLVCHYALLQVCAKEY